MSERRRPHDSDAKPTGGLQPPRAGPGDENLDEIVADYSDDAIFITPAGVLRGKDGIRQAFTRLLSELPQATWDLKTTIGAVASDSSAAC
jgi:SnoaL-like domain